eukprot:489798_1
MHPDINKDVSQNGESQKTPLWAVVLLICVAVFFCAWVVFGLGFLVRYKMEKKKFEERVASLRDIHVTMNSSVNNNKDVSQNGESQKTPLWAVVLVICVAVFFCAWVVFGLGFLVRYKMEKKKFEERVASLRDIHVTMNSSVNNKSEGHT